MKEEKTSKNCLSLKQVQKKGQFNHFEKPDTDDLYAHEFTY